MYIREATIVDAENIRNVYLQAFDDSEARLVSDVAVKLLEENHPVKTLSLVAIENDAVVGHIAFSPVVIKDTNEYFGYILAPLAVSPEYQNNKIGTSLIKYGLGAISEKGSFIIFVYGDPQYYSRFGFKPDLAQGFIPPHTLQFPEGWHALKMNSADLPEEGKITCVAALDDPDLW